MWSIPIRPADRERFPGFTPIELLDDYDGPRLFTVNDSEGEPHLAYWSDGDEHVCRYVVVPTSKFGSGDRMMSWHFATTRACLGGAMILH